jgi:hypothetical protein
VRVALVFDKIGQKNEAGRPRKGAREKPSMVMKKSASQRFEPASRESSSRLPASPLIAGKINELGDWRGEMLARLRALIRQGWGAPSCKGQGSATRRDGLPDQT